MFMQPSNFADFEAALTDAVNTGQVSMARIDDAVSRILTKKFELGLFEHPYTDRTHLPEVGDAAHRAVARQAVQESQVLLRNQKHALPIRRNGGRIYVAGSNADNIGNQAGGWTLTWQGGSDDLFGAAPDTGKLPVTWRRTVSQEPINVGDPNYDPLYAFGFGLHT